MVVGPMLMDEAAREGYTSVVLWLYRHLGISWTVRTVREAALGGHKHLIDCVHGSRSLPLPVNKACLLAALIGGRDARLAQTIRHAGQPWSPVVMAVAVALGKRRTVLELDAVGCPHGDLAVALAIVRDRWDLLSAMAATDDEIERAAAVLDYGPHCQHARAGRRYASVVCDAAVLGIRGRQLAKAILHVYDTRAMGIRCCRHHQPEVRAKIDATPPPNTSLWGPLLWFPVTHYATIRHHVQEACRARRADLFQTWAMNVHHLAAAPSLPDTRNKHDDLGSGAVIQRPPATEHIARAMRDRESRARRQGAPVACTRADPPRASTARTIDDLVLWRCRFLRGGVWSLLLPYFFARPLLPTKKKKKSSLCLGILFALDHNRVTKNGTAKWSGGSNIHFLSGSLFLCAMQHIVG